VSKVETCQDRAGVEDLDVRWVRDAGTTLVQVESQPGVLTAAKFISVQ